MGLFLTFAIALSAEDLATLKTPRIIELRDRVHHVQGIDIEGHWLWLTSVDTAAARGYLHLFDLRTGRQVSQVEVQDGPRFHAGGITLDRDSIWIPVAENRRLSTSVIQRRDKRSLALLSSFPVDDHIGCVAAFHGGLVGGNWDSRELYEWDRSGRLIRKRANPSKVAYQDLKIRGRVLIGSGTVTRDEGAVEWLEWPSMQVRRTLTTGKTDRGVRFTNEGMTIRGRLLYLLPEDGFSRLFAFRLR